MIKKIILIIWQIFWHRTILRWRQFFKFCVVGTLGAIIDIGGLYLLVELVSLYYLTAAAISFMLAVVNNYLLNKYWTFHNKSSQYTAQFVSFLLVSLIGLLINLAVMYLLVGRIGVWYLLAKAIASIVVLVWNFSMNKYVIFKALDY